MSLHIFERKRDSRGFPDVSVATATKRRRHKARRRKRRAFTFEHLEQKRVLSTLLVDTFDDIVNSGDAYLSLREAIIEANSNNESDTINLSAGTYAFSRSGVAEDSSLTGDLDIVDDVSGHDLTIVGVGADTTTIDAAGLDRVFDIHTGATVAISDVTIRNGQNDYGGGIRNDGTLAVSNSEITGNAAIYGGGIYNPDYSRGPSLAVTCEAVGWCCENRMKDAHKSPFPHGVGLLVKW